MSSKKLIRILPVLLLAAIFTSTTALADEMPYNGMSADTCTVRSHLWRQNTSDRDQMSLLAALYYANPGSGARFDACQEDIILQPEEGYIRVEGPIVIARDGLTITGNGDEPVRLQADRFDSGRFGDFTVEGHDFGENHCLITIVSTGVTLRHINLANIGDGMNAICIDGGNATLDDVQVTSADGDAVVFGAGGGGIIKANSVIDSGVQGYGVTFMNTDADTFSTAIIETAFLNNASGASWDSLPLIPNSYGISEILDGLTTRFTINVPTNRFFNNAGSKIKIITKDLLKVNDPVADAEGRDGSSYIWFRGWVVDESDQNNPDAQIEECESANPLCCLKSTNKVERIQIYKSEQVTEDGTTQRQGKAYGYIGGWNTEYNSGLQTGSNQAGYISAYFKESEFSDVALVPQGVNGGVGQPRYLVVREDRTGDCPDREPTGLGGGGGGNGDRQGFVSRQDCKNYGGIWESQQHRGDAPGYNTDGDELSDDEEDFNKNCNCDQGETCWDLPDSDHDGVLDGLGKEMVCKKANGAVVACTDTTVVNEGEADKDGDGIVNALDMDSDNDGRKDYQEDRNIYYDDLLRSLQSADGNAMTGHLYYINRGSQNERPIQYSGALQTCDLLTGADVGVRYAWYLMTYTDDSYQILARAPVELGDSLPEQKGKDAEGDSSETTYEFLACRHQALTSALNFNGAYDAQNMETDMLNVDTDNDTYCDGDNTPDPASGTGKCTTPVQAELDMCPTVNDTTNNCSNRPCSPQILLFGVNPDFYNSNGGVPQSLKRVEGEYKAFVQTNAEDTAVIRNEDGSLKYRSWQEITNICFGDLDQDGIPNCVEAPNSTCGNDVLTGLNASKADTDGDDFIDGWRGGAREDVCPAGPGGDMDAFEEGRTNYSCDAEKVYERLPILSCFFDRDGDSLRDCIEDLDMNGKFDNIIQGLEGIGTTETNALSKHSDEDGIEDGVEYFGWQIVTNPADKDTDEDGLDDNLENRDGDTTIDLNQVSSLLQGENECPNAMSHDTDPTNPDTDGDGLNDGVEISGSMIVGDDFIAMLGQLDVYSGGGVDVVSDPRSVDSDNDGLGDGMEYSGVILSSSSHPCMIDSDGDGVEDGNTANPGARVDACPLNARYSDAANCGTSTEPDYDRDGAPDAFETPDRLGTDPRNPDTDGDGLKDGEEDLDHDGIYDPADHEPNPLVTDTDSDGLNDGLEMRLGTDPTNPDSDGDCIPDGPSSVTDPTTGAEIMSLGEDRNRNGDYNVGSDTDPTLTDTDGDGLPDGNMGGYGEDMNCNGRVDVDASGRRLETDNKLLDSDNDGVPDNLDVRYRNGVLYPGNAVSGKQGCFTIVGTTGEPNVMMYLFGLLLVANRIVSLRLRKRG